MIDFSAAQETFAHAIADKSRFYRDWFARNSCVQHVPRTKKEWSTLPLLSKEDLVTTPFEARLFVPLHMVETIRVTSGTSGAGIVVMPRFLPTPLREEALHPGKTLMSFFYLTSAVASARGERRQKIISGDFARLEASAALARQAHIDALYGPASILIAFVPYLSEEERQAIRYINISAERLSRIQLAALRTHYPSAVFSNLYALQEVGQIAFASPSSDNVLLLEPLPYHYIEVLSEQGALALEDVTREVEGELVVTSVGKVPFPHIRYRTGDRVRVHPRRGVPRIEVLGRAEEERVRIPGGELVLAELERALGEVAGAALDDFECTVGEEKSTGSVLTTMHLTLYFKLDMPFAGLANKLAHELRVNQERRWSDGVAHKIYAPLTCEFRSSAVGFQKRRHLTDLRL